MHDNSLNHTEQPAVHTEHLGHRWHLKWGSTPRLGCCFVSGCPPPLVDCRTAAGAAAGGAAGGRAAAGRRDASKRRQQVEQADAPRVGLPSVAVLLAVCQPAVPTVASFPRQADDDAVGKGALQNEAGHVGVSAPRHTDPPKGQRTATAGFQLGVSAPRQRGYPTGGQRAEAAGLPDRGQCNAAAGCRLRGRWAMAAGLPKPRRKAVGAGVVAASAAAAAGDADSWPRKGDRR